MSPDLFFAVTILALAAYMAVNALWTNEFTRLQSGGRRLAAHVAGGALAAGMGVAALGTLDPAYHFGASYLFMPLLYLVLLVSASKFSHHRYGRPLRPANAINMAQESMRDAPFSDYAFFILVHFVPLLLPAAVFEGLLGVPV